MTENIKCKRHSEQDVLYFCYCHNDIFCQDCKTAKHQSCSDIVDMRHFQNSSDLHDKILGKLQNSLEQFNSVVPVLVDNSLQLERDKVIFRNTITHFRRKIESQLVSMESKILDEYEKVYNDVSSKMKELEENFKLEKSKIEKFCIEFTDIFSHEQGVETFFELQRIISEISKENDLFQNMYFNDNMLSIDFTMAKEMFSFQEIKYFGSVNLKKTSISRLIQKHEITNISTDSEQPLPSCFEILETLDIPFENDEVDIVDLKELSDGHIVMTDRLSETVMLYNMAANTIRSINIGSRPDCISVMGKETIAVTQGRQNVVIIDLLIWKTLKCIDMQDKVEGITAIYSKLFVNCATKGIQIISFNGDGIGSIPNINGRLYLYAISWRDQIICADQEKNTVTCINGDGEVLFRFNTSKFDSPYGITVDDNGWIYIVGIDSNNIIRIDENGGQRQTVMNSKNGLERPFVILYLRDRTFLVSNGNGRSIVRCKWK